MFTEILMPSKVSLLTRKQRRGSLGLNEEYEHNTSEILAGTPLSKWL